MADEMIDTGYGYECTRILKSSLHYIGAQLAECMSNFYIHPSCRTPSEIFKKRWQSPGIAYKAETSAGNAESTVAALLCCNSSKSLPAYTEQGFGYCAAYFTHRDCRLGLLSQQVHA